MRTIKSPFFSANAGNPLSRDHAEQQVALEYLAEAWNLAEDDGVDAVALAHASLFAALATLVQAHGENATAEIVATLPEKIMAGDYNLDRSVQ